MMYRAALCLSGALHGWHAVTVLHADVKGDSVVLNTADLWRLADYGACIEFGQSEAVPRYARPSNTA